MSHLKNALFVIEIPTLRDRPGDIRLIAQKLVDDLCRKLGRPPVQVMDAEFERLEAHQWPGNVRELMNQLERSLITARPGMLDLESSMRSSGDGVQAPTVSVPGEESDAPILTVEQLQDLERANFLRALERCDWKISGEEGAAVLLGLKPSTLNSRLKSMGIERPR